MTCVNGGALNDTCHKSYHKSFTVSEINGSRLADPTVGDITAGPELFNIVSSILLQPDSQCA